MVLVFGGMGWREECEETPLSPFTGLDLGLAVRSGGVGVRGAQYVVSRDLHMKSGH